MGGDLCQWEIMGMGQFACNCKCPISESNPNFTGDLIQQEIMGTMSFRHGTLFNRSENCYGKYLKTQFENWDKDSEMGQNRTPILGLKTNPVTTS